MPSSAAPLITVFGGTGFLGPRVVPLFGRGATRLQPVLVEQVLDVCGRRRLLLPVPFAIWRLLAALMKPLPSPPLTFDQVVLMERDNVVPGDRPGFAALGIEPRGVLEWLEAR